MADNGPPAPGTQLPPPPTTAGAPGYDNQNGMGNPHMPPPPLPPVIIPQNTNPIPTAITSPMTGENGVIMSPDSQGGFVRRAAPEPNKRALYVGGLDPRVTEDVLRQIFETTGHVQNVKIIPDKNVGAVSINFISVKLLEILAFPLTFPAQHADSHWSPLTDTTFVFLPRIVQHANRTTQFQSKGFNYGFVEYDDPGAAERAMQTLNGRRVHQAVCTMPPAAVVFQNTDSSRKFASTGHTNPTHPIRKIHQIISIFSSAIFLTRSMMRSFFKRSPLSALFLRPE
jgi:nucleolysin TIA-1/TIAR